MKFTYMKTPLYRMTFQNKRIKEWVESKCQGLVLNLFAGETQLYLPKPMQEFRNDIREKMPAHYHKDALEFVVWWKESPLKFDTVILDPPYSYRKSMEMYEGAKASRFTHMLNELPNIMKPSGIVITFGYQSVVMGKGRGFAQEHILLISPGGAIHDVIATIERKIIT